MGIYKNANLPCPCKSGRKYKRCCLEKDRRAKKSLDPELVKIAYETMEKQRRRKIKLESIGIYINFVIPTIYKNKKVWGLGNKVFLDRPSDETFHQFILYILRIRLGEEWWKEQTKESTKHFIMQCYDHLSEWTKQLMSSPANLIKERMWSGPPSGWVQHLLSLAFDIATLTHSLKLPEKLLTRLKNSTEYQSARYEIAIAAIFARLGFVIDFLDDTSDLSLKHCEFIATHEIFGSVSVEAKSRHRSGVIHTDGQFNEEKALKGDVTQLFNKALTQAYKNYPFFVFIDVNCPMKDGERMEDKRWIKDVKKNLFNKLSPASMTNLDRFNAVFFTNHPYHYEPEKIARHTENLTVTSGHPRYPLINNNLYDMLKRALDNYGVVPNIDEEITP